MPPEPVLHPSQKAEAGVNTPAHNLPVGFDGVFDGRPEVVLVFQRKFHHCPALVRIVQRREDLSLDPKSGCPICELSDTPGNSSAMRRKSSAVIRDCSSLSIAICCAAVNKIPRGPAVLPWRRLSRKSVFGDDHDHSGSCGHAALNFALRASSKTPRKPSTHPISSAWKRARLPDHRTNRRAFRRNGQGPMVDR